MIPEPPLDADDVPLPDGEAVALPIPTGAAMTLRFPSPFEPYIVLGGARIVDDISPEAREVLLWASRRLPALWRALEDRVALCAVFEQRSDHQRNDRSESRGERPGAPIVVTDLVALERDEEPVWFDHGLLRERLEAANVELARFSLLGALSTKAELERRVRATYAPGTLVEVRVEDGRRVVARRRVRVGR